MMAYFSNPWVLIAVVVVVILALAYFMSHKKHH